MINALLLSCILATEIIKLLFKNKETIKCSNCCANIQVMSERRKGFIRLISN